jgi:hypothetical protein
MFKYYGFLLSNELDNSKIAELLATREIIDGDIKDIDAELLKR